MSQPKPLVDGRHSPWIVSGVFDLALFVATPLAIIPVVLVAAWNISSPEQIALIVFAFASLGHHLPGLMRAYGDPELFHRFRWRFLLAPPAFLTVSWLSFVTYQSHGLEVILLFWATWHIMMQTYGFMRIYDAKLGNRTPLDARIDFCACGVVFAAGIVFSDARVFGISESLSLAGLPIMSRMWLVAIRWCVGIATFTVITVVVCRTISLWRQNAATVSWLKPLLLCTTAALYWTAGMVSVNLLIGVAMFEVFHAVQYYAIVWFFNRRRAGEENVGPFMAMFRPNLWGLPLYGLAICVFGSLGFLGRTGVLSSTSTIAMALFSTSAMLHFYYDGFIWQVREKRTQEGLNVRSKANADAGSMATRHGFKWTCLAMILVVLCALENSATPGSPDNAERRLTALAQLTPNQPELQTRLSQHSLLTGNPQAAFESARQAARHRPRSYAAHIALGNASTTLAKWKVAEHAFSVAAILRIDSPEAHYGCGLAHVQRQNYEAARQSLETCLHLRDDHAQACFQLGNVYYYTDQTQKAIVNYRRCTKLDPSHADAFNNLGAVLFETDDLTNAATAYQMAITLNPENAAAHYNLGLVYYFQGFDEKARGCINHAKELGHQPTPEIVEALHL